MPKNLEDLVDKYSDELSGKKNVVAIAVGEKWTDGKPTGKEAIIILVEEKLIPSELSEEDKIPSELDGVITDVVGKTGKLSKLSYTRRYRPSPAGVSCGHFRITAGTIGGYFKDRQNKLVLLSNNHVLASENNARLGDPITQPGPYDRGRTGRDTIAKLRAFERLVKQNQRIRNVHLGRKVNYNLEDSAIAVVSHPNKVKNQLMKDGVITGFNFRPRVGMRVHKIGRTTRRTVNRIIGTHATVYVRYDIGVLVFRRQILTHAMSRGGDSGSILLDGSNRAVGLLFAGSNTITIHNPIIYPVRRYGLKIWGMKPPPAKPAPRRRVRRRTRTRRRLGRWDYGRRRRYRRDWRNRRRNRRRRYRRRR